MVLGEAMAAAGLAVDEDEKENEDEDDEDPGSDGDMRMGIRRVDVATDGDDNGQGCGDDEGGDAGPVIVSKKKIKTRARGGTFKGTFVKDRQQAELDKGDTGRGEERYFLYLIWPCCQSAKHHNSFYRDCHLSCHLFLTSLYPPPPILSTLSPLSALFPHYFLGNTCSEGSGRRKQHCAGDCAKAGSEATEGGREERKGGARGKGGDDGQGKHEDAGLCHHHHRQ
jgi:hypothetical protein